MGGGAIWAMHFIAMLGCQMEIPVAYDLTLTFASALVGIASCTVGLAVASSDTFSWSRLIVAGVAMGLGVGGMHYMGMAAMLMPATTVYDVNIVAISIVIAIAASIVALWLAFHMRGLVQLLGSVRVKVIHKNEHNWYTLVRPYLSDESFFPSHPQGSNDEFDAALCHSVHLLAKSRAGVLRKRRAVYPGSGQSI
jgi:hypothetical protein